MSDETDLITDQVKYVADEIIQTYIDDEGKNTQMLIMAGALVAYSLARLGELPHEDTINMLVELGEDYEPFGDRLVEKREEIEEEDRKIQEMGDNVVPFPNKETIH